MKVTNQRYVDPADKSPAHFNGGEHLFVDIDPNKFQTISCKLPNGKFVTFAFVPSGTEQHPSDEIECVDIHCNCAEPEPRCDKAGTYHQQHVVGFCIGSTSFDTRNRKQVDRETSLATLLLSSKHYTKA